MKSKANTLAFWIVLGVVIVVVSYWFLSRKKVAQPTPVLTVIPSTPNTPVIYSAPTPAGTPTPTPAPIPPIVNPYNLFVSGSGNDSNTGLAANLPVLSLASLRQKAMTFGNAVKIKFGNESQYREELDLSSLSGVEIDGGYSTLDASDVVPKSGWTQPDAANLPNLWGRTWTTTGNIREGYVMKIDGVSATLKTSQALCNAATGTFYADASITSVSSFQIFVSSTTNPNTNSVVYEIMKRPTGLRVGMNAVVRNLITGTQTDNDGSAIFGKDSLVEKSLFANGHKHNVFIQSGTMRDCIAFDASDFQPAAGPFVAYMQNTTGESITWTRCLVVMPDWKKTLVGGFFGHSATDGIKYDSFTIEGAIGYKINSIGTPSANAGTFKNNYALAYGLDSPVSCPLVIERCLYSISPPQGANALAASIRYAVTYLNVAVYSLPGQSFFQLHDGAVLTLTNSSFVSDNRNLIDPYGVNLPVEVHFFRNVFLQKSGIDLNRVATYSGNYNVYFNNDWPWDNIRFNDSSGDYNTLALWQAHSGQDLKSVYLTAAQKATFFLGDPATGDFRINPQAQVTASDGTVYTGTFPDGTLLTTAGVQEHYNYNTRAVVAGPPTRFPVPPTTYIQSVQHIKNPSAWNFYPA